MQAGQVTPPGLGFRPTSTSSARSSAPSSFSFSASLRSRAPDNGLTFL